jgi:phosphoglycolate phosphatase-like HAD superfamily hydrolase
MNELQAVIFDFDGVILESVEIKKWAYGELFNEYPGQRDEIVAYHMENGGLPRFDKFRYIYRVILKEALTDKKFTELCNCYSDLVFERIVSCEFVPGALQFLKKYKDSIPMFVVTGTPQEEIDRVIIAKELKIYFSGVYGSPEGKDFWTRRILDAHAFDPTRILWVGDALSDYQAAVMNDIKFVARVGGGKDIFRGKDVYKRINNLFELDELLMKQKCRIVKERV